MYRLFANRQIFKLTNYIKINKFNFGAVNKAHDSHDKHDTHSDEHHHDHGHGHGHHEEVKDYHPKRFDRRSMAGVQRKGEREE
jgi:hypothetical protein